MLCLCEGFSEEMTVELRSERRVAVKYTKNKGKTIPKSMCKGPEVGGREKTVSQEGEQKTKQHTM